MKDWNVGYLEPDLLFEVIDNRDPETSSRFAFPIPNWLGENKEPIFEHPSIQFIEKKQEYRLIFKNYVDGCDQGVKINGQGVILFMTPTPSQTSAMISIIQQLYDADTVITPQMAVDALEKIYTETGIIDRWNSDQSDLDAKYDKVDTELNGYFGRYVYKYRVSAAIAIEGKGVFDGPAVTKQRFDDGAYILFPNMPIEKAKEVIENYDPYNPTKTGAKVVRTSEFLKTRRYAKSGTENGLAIKPYELKAQSEPKRLFYKPTPIAGFPDQTADIANLEREWIAKIGAIYASYGYPQINTRAVEEMRVLRSGTTSDGAVEIYPIGTPTDKKNEEGQLGLRFDHTVPLARYIAENKARITLPFKSARIGSVWRNQNIKRGKAKEFTQADIDIICESSVPIEYDAEFPKIMADIVHALGLGDVQIGISNRKITEGFFTAHGFEEDIVAKIVKLIELRHEIGIDGIRAKMIDGLGLDKDLADLCINFALIQSSNNSFAKKVRDFGQTNAVLEEGLDELSLVMDKLQGMPHSTVKADLSVVRGFNYYTGTVYEGRFGNDTKYPPVIVGGRYDNLVAEFMRESRPGAGISFDVSMAMSIALSQGLCKLPNPTSTQALIVYESAQSIPQAEALADNMRAKGHCVDIVYGKDRKRQMQYAHKKGIQEVILVNDNGVVEHRDLDMSLQGPFDPNNWSPK